MRPTRLIIAAVALLAAGCAGMDETACRTANWYEIGEREVGAIGTAVVSPTRGPLALALLRRRAAPGSRVRVGEVSGIVEP